jgi:APA family basic amino acid/polyamine antiporter
MSIGTGQIIGSGIMVLTGICIEITGAGTPFAFILAALLVMCPALVLSVLGSAVPATGGMYTYVRDYIGKKTGFFYLSLLIAGQLVLAMFAITFAEYACSLMPSLNSKLVAFGILTLCYVANLSGLNVAAKVQNVMVVVLMVTLVLFVVFGMPKVDFSVFSKPNAIMPNGLIAFLTAASLLTFATGGAEFLSELGGEMKDPGKDLPKAMITSTAGVAVLYALIGIVAVGVLPIDKVAGQSLVEVARAIFPTPLFIIFVIGGGMFAVATSLNATFSWCTKGLLIAAREGWLPAKAASVGKRGTPYILLTIFYIIGAVPIITGISIRTIAMLGNGVSLIYVMFPIFTGYLVYKKNPTAMAKAPFKVGKTALAVLTTIALGGYAMAAILNFTDIANSLFMILGYSVVVLIYAFLREKKITATKK